MIARFILLAGAASFLPVASPVFAQEEPPRADSGSDEEIVVTARRREESVQDVPIAIAVISGDRIEETGNSNVQKLTQLLPSLQFYTSNPRNSAANIRGLGAPFGLTNDGIEQGVGVYIDEVYNSRIAAATFDFLDVERVEVLRGPQGTLYGKNTTAGAINITTRAPTFDAEGRVEVSAGSLGYVNGKASISGPIVRDRLAVRFAASATSRRGTIYNLTTDQWVNEQDNLGLRGQLLLRAAPSVHFTLSADYNRQDPECCAQIYVRTGATQRPLNRQFAALAAAFDYAPPSTDAFDRLTDLDSPLDALQEIGGVALRAKWDLGPGELTSVTAWRFWNWGPSNDRDFTGLPITTVSANPSRQNQFSQELRYAATGSRFDYVLGLFAYRQKQHTTGAQEQGAAASRWLLNPSSPGAHDPSVLDGLRSENDILLRTTSLAAFGRLSWHVAGRMRIEPGIRLNHDRKYGSYVAVVTNGTNTPLTAEQRGVLAPQAYEARFSDWNVSGDLTLSYDVAGDLLLYGTYARGFKSGGINLAGLPLDASSQPILSAATVKPEKLGHLEAGLKAQLWHGRATMNLAAFRTVIRDYQATVTNGQHGVLRGYLANADKVRVQGLEADLAVRASRTLDLHAAGAFTDHEYARFTDAPCPPELSGGAASPPNCDISGQWLPGISRWAVSAGGEFHRPANLLGKAGEVYAGLDANYRSRFSSNASRSAYTDIDGYALVNLRLGFRSDDGWNLFGWVRNALDADYYDMLATQSGNTGLVVGQPGDPRTFGVTVAKRF